MAGEATAHGLAEDLLGARHRGVVGGAGHEGLVPGMGGVVTEPDGLVGPENGRVLGRRGARREEESR